MCRCSEKYNIEYVKNIAIRYANATGEKIAVYQNADESYNYCPYDFAIENSRKIVFEYESVQ